MTTPQAALGKVSRAGNAAGSLITPGGKQPKVSTPLGSAPVVPLILFGIGGYLMWFGVHYFRDDSVFWPTTPIKSVLQGNGVPLASPMKSGAVTLDAFISGEGAADQSAASAGTAPAGGGGGVPVPSGKSMATYIKAGAALGPNGTAGQNQALAHAMMGAFDPSWTEEDWTVLVAGWTAESRWETTIFNEPGNYGGAYGIPQADPGTKMASAGADWKTNPATQILWGFGYIKGEYGRPSTVPGWPPGPGYKGY